MAKKYKLIKAYPGSPDLGTILEYDNHAYMDDTYIYDRESIEKYPEFWQETRSRDYKVLLVEHGCGILEAPTNKNVDQLLSKEGAKILQASSLDTGQIFRIGDKVVRINPVLHRKGTIKSLEDFGGELFIRTEHYNVPMCHIELPKPVVVITDDGVELYKGDKYYLLDTYTFLIEERVISGNYNITNTSMYRRYSTREKAEEDILYNKPTVSLNEVRDAINNKLLVIGALKELAKKRI